MASLYSPGLILRFLRLGPVAGSLALRRVVPPPPPPVEPPRERPTTDESPPVLPAEPLAPLCL